MKIRNWLTGILLLSLFFSCKEEQKESVKKFQTLSSDNTTVTFDYHLYQKKYGSCLNNIDCAEVKINYPQLLNGSNKIELINNAIISQLLSDNDEDASYQSFDEISDSLFSQYQNVQKAFSDYKTGWSILKNMNVSGVVNNFISIKKEVIIYTGGANNYFNVTLSIFDLNSGEQQLLSKFVNLEKMDELLKIGEKNFKKIKNISEDQTLRDSCFWFENDKFYLPDNFSVSDYGFVFFYNLYEITPRSEGFTELFIPKEELLDVLITGLVYL